MGTLVLKTMEKVLFSSGDFLQKITNACKLMLTDHNFADVTLVVDGQKRVKAHKFLLGAYSQVFKDMFGDCGLNLNQTQSIVYLLGAKHEDLNALLQFLYLGETHVEPDQLPSFLHLSKELKIEGLAALEKENFEIKNFVEKGKSEMESLDDNGSKHSEIQDEKMLQEDQESISEFDSFLKSID